ncbi:hypothetical protein D6E43_23525 [Salmonella enterica]|uniref:Uncharacterized protein n=2 Tax=Salmonella enterica TaxID=28901 RepID=A0A5T6JRX2_SALER|nr:hypothetical protein [Salmonella enterica]ECI0412048.1 hypothetical protein [Salmonella enterica subsp. salamae]ECS1831611.1 hypothetical protein [Salmonella enterica subsp. enterica serovar Norwich]EAP1424317.1 hypothetical protein [Salmonella enterica]EAQ7535334.1 hypothetical protein [Salmonella enterica]
MATATPIIFPQYCIDSPKRYAIGEAISHKIRCFSANEGYGQLWDIAYNLHYHTCHSMPCLTPQTLNGRINTGAAKMSKLGCDRLSRATLPMMEQ